MRRKIAQKNTLIVLGVILYVFTILAFVFVTYSIGKHRGQTIIIDDSGSDEPIEIQIDNNPTNIISIIYDPMPKKEVKADTSVAPDSVVTRNAVAVNKKGDELKSGITNSMKQIQDDNSDIDKLLDNK